MRILLALGVLACGFAARAQKPAQATVIEMEGTVQTAPARTTDWRAAKTNDALAALDRIRTREQSRAALRLIDRSLFRLGELSELTVEPMADEKSPANVGLVRGVLFFLHRGRPKDVELRTRTVSAAIRGTEFHVEVADNGRTVLTLFDGEVELANPQGTLRLVSGEQGTVDPGQPPVKTAMLVPRHDLIQWCLYYPGVLDVDELSLVPAETAALQASLAAYRAGDLLQALALVPAGFAPASGSARVYLAAVSLAAGKVDAAAPLLDGVPAANVAPAGKPSPAILAAALRQMIAVVKNAPKPEAASLGATNCATLLLAESYARQTRADLAAALVAAREAARLSPEFAFAWERVAELEFSFGRRDAAMTALHRSLALAPRNAQAVALRGYLLAAADRIDAARAAFEQAIALDGALGNAWLGRGLCRIRRGDLDGGREDMQVAATLEPQRALLRSYLGKAFHELGEQSRAAAEFRLARENDPRDPTAFLYEALLLQEENRINEAIAALERSQELNDNRRVFRSRLLLDQDQAVRGANLATIYRDAGMEEWSVREAAKAVGLDYANWSAHLFLADSYNARRDMRSVNLRYETPWLSEYLIANLLAPAGAGVLSPSVSAQEYARLFERNHAGLVNSTEYLGRGAWSQSAAQFGVLDRTSYVIEGAYLNDPGEHVNGRVEQSAFSFQAKQQITPEDGLFFQVALARTKGGDLNERYNPDGANPELEFRDEQKPLLMMGWHHEWGPGQHTLVLASRLEGRLRVDDPYSLSFNTFRVNGLDRLMVPQVYDQLYGSRLEIFSGEVQHIVAHGDHTLVLGARAQGGGFDTRNRHVPMDAEATTYWRSFAYETNLVQRHDEPFRRYTGYTYDTWQVLAPLRLVGGVAYDYVEAPANHRWAPISGGTTTTQGVTPKAGLVWDVSDGSTVRFAYTRSLSGTSFDQSFRLEPTEVAGFNQAFRSVIPETLVGALSGAVLDTFDLGWEHRFPTRTYVGVTLEMLQSSDERWRGAYVQTNAGLPAAGRVREQLDYEEKSLRAAVDQLIGENWSLGARYEWSRAELESTWLSARRRVVMGFDFNTGLPVYSPNQSRIEGDLHQVRLHLLFHHATGFFAGTEGVWLGQSAEQNGAALPSAGFWQWNLAAGWRSPRRRVECTVGLLNVLEEWEGTHPINLHSSPLRARTFASQLRFRF